MIHLRQAVFAGQECASNIDRHDGVEDVLGVFGNRLDGTADACVAEQHIDLAPFFNGAVDIRHGLPGIRYVGYHGSHRVAFASERSDGLREHLFVVVYQHDSGAFLQQEPGTFQT